MATTRATLRQRLSETIGDWSGTLVTSGGGSTTTIVDTSLANLPGGADDDFCEGYYAMITHTGHTAVGESRRVTSYTASSKTITVAEAYGASSGSSKNYELHRYDPDLKHYAINAAGRKLFPNLYLPVIDETLVTDQLGTNMDFETYSNPSDAAPDGWTALTNTRVDRYQDRVMHGSNSTSLRVTTGPSDLGFYQNLIVDVADIVGKSITFGGYMWSTNANSGWFVVSFGGSSYSESPKHDGDEDWQEEWVTATIPADASEITIQCNAINREDSGHDIPTYFDALYCYITPLDRYTLPTTFIEDSPTHVSIQTDMDNQDNSFASFDDWWIDSDGETNYLRLGVHPPGRRIRLKGRGALTLPSSDSTSMEVEDSRVDIVVEWAAYELFMRLAAMSIGTDSADYVRQATIHKQMAEELLRKPGVRMARATTLRMPSVVI